MQRTKITSGSCSSPKVKRVWSFVVCLFVFNRFKFIHFLGGGGLCETVQVEAWLQLTLAASQLVQEGKSAVSWTFCSVPKPHLPSRGSQHTLYQLRLTRWNEVIMSWWWQAGFRFWTKYPPPTHTFFSLFHFCTKRLFYYLRRVTETHKKTQSKDQKHCKCALMYYLP